MPSNFLAKLIAGGLSAAVVLVWWPAVFPSDSVASWLARGIVWTLAMEVLTIAFAPLERALWGTSQGRRLREHAARRAPSMALGRSATLACSALAVVAFLLTFAPQQPRPHQQVATKKVTEVHRVVRVVRKPVEVTRVVSSPETAAPAPAVTTSSKRTSVPRPADHATPHVRVSTPRSHQQTQSQQPATQQEPATSTPVETAPTGGEQGDSTADATQPAAPKPLARS